MGCCAEEAGRISAVLSFSMFTTSQVILYLFFLHGKYFKNGWATLSLPKIFRKAHLILWRRVQDSNLRTFRRSQFIKLVPSLTRSQFSKLVPSPLGQLSNVYKLQSINCLTTNHSADRNCFRNSNTNIFIGKKKNYIPVSTIWNLLPGVNTLKVEKECTSAVFISVKCGY
jgi:hypothetical protein